MTVPIDVDLPDFTGRAMLRWIILSFLAIAMGIPLGAVLAWAVILSVNGPAANGLWPWERASLYEAIRDPTTDPVSRANFEAILRYAASVNAANPFLLAAPASDCR